MFSFIGYTCLQLAELNPNRDLYNKMIEKGGLELLIEAKEEKFLTDKLQEMENLLVSQEKKRKLHRRKERSPCGCFVLFDYKGY